MGELKNKNNHSFHLEWAVCLANFHNGPAEILSLPTLTPCHCCSFAWQLGTCKEKEGVFGEGALLGKGFWGDDGKQDMDNFFEWKNFGELWGLPCL